MAVPAATRVAGGASSSYQLHAPWPIHITRGAYARLEALNLRLTAGIDAAIAEQGLPFHTAAVGSKGCVRLGPEPVVDYQSFKRRHDPELSELAWLLVDKPRPASDTRSRA
jgi:glutamate-1-semialdehyde aminotransferase